MPTYLNRRGVINEVDWSSVPKGERFNPYDYITQDNYRNTRRGHASYAEDLARLQYLADLAQQDWQNAYNEARVADERAYNEKLTADDREYNSYANQVALMKQAGLNPDLLGVSLGTSQTPTSGTNSSASGSDVSTNPLSGIMTNGQVAGNVVSIIGSVAQTAMSLYTGGLSAVGLGISNASQALSMIGNAVSTFDNSQGLSMSDIINSSPLSSRMKRKLTNSYGSYFASPRDKSNYHVFGSNAKNNEASWFFSRINPLYNPEDSNKDGIISESDWSEVWKPIFDAEFALMKKGLSNKSKSYDVESSSLDLQKSENDYMLALKEPFREVIDNMYRKYKQGNDFWGYALSAFYMILSVKGFNFSTSESSKGSSKTSFSFGVK